VFREQKSPIGRIHRLSLAAIVTSPLLLAEPPTGCMHTGSSKRAGWGHDCEQWGMAVSQNLWPGLPDRRAARHWQSGADSRSICKSGPVSV